MQPLQPSPSTQHSTFAEKVRPKIRPLTTFSHPSEDQGFIFDSQKGTKVNDYLRAFYKLVGDGDPKNIKAAYRVSGEKIIVFLATKEQLENIQQAHGGFLFNNTFIKTRKLKSPAAKLIISNVSAIIPNELLEKTLRENFNLKLVSPIALLRGSPTDELFSHVVSSRRQVYIHSTDNKPSYPSSFLLPYGDRNYRIYLHSDEMTCFKCSSRGHKAEDCTIVLDDELESDQISPNSLPSDLQLVSPTDFPSLPLAKVQPIVTKSAEMPTSKPISPTPAVQQNKRTSSVLNSTAGSIKEDELTDSSQPPTPASTNTTIKLVQMQSSQVEQSHKRHKTDTPRPPRPPLIFTADEVSKISEKFDSIMASKPAMINFTAKQFMEFLPATRNTANKLALAKELSPDLSHLLFILDEIKPLVTQGAKVTITALIKVIHGQAGNSSGHSDTE